ncbi:T9SS type A sorting domain-containing protein [Aquiflexum sp. LQ15W]|uniref:T9SS type A sorting domain-containing protein n=1 Tax=Cognataquiflexum nitidum TaxID=2922272 RepID=UPI001F12D2BF|nr:T9SS type A sorting domain-containing protein [Cognataquiflexum nitidum]MCH6200187.1 T9SS type A sorting domain-containing protein [Cognataquiflexum nitidum]
MVCPNEPTQYFTEPTSTNGSNCVYTWNVTNGVFSNGLTQISGSYAFVSTVTVFWNNVVATSGSVAPKGTISVTASGCALPVGEIISSTVPNIIIKTLNNVNPSPISGSPNVNLGSINNITYSITRLAFPNTGVPGGHPSTLYADSYQWLIPAGWQIGTTTSNGTTPITTTGFSVSVKPNSCGGNNEKIKVWGYSACGTGFLSNPQEITISRNPPPLTILQAPPATILCSNVSPITASVNPVPGATSYTWTKPSGWAGTSNTNSITLTPSGTNGGIIEVRANICSTQTAPLQRTVTLQLFDPSSPPSIAGPLVVCSPNTGYSIQNLPTGTTGSWSVSPASLVSVASGTGTTANLTRANGTSSGVATLTFNITGPCGALPTITKQIQIGYVNGSEATISASCNIGTLCYVCPGNTYVFTANPPLGHQSTYSYQWTKPTNWTIINQSANTITLYVPQYNPDFFPAVRFRVNNGCGWSEYSGLKVAPGYSCGGGYYGYSIYPNPTSDVLTVEPEIKELFKSMEDSVETEPYTVTVLDENGKEMEKATSKGDKIQISLRNLKSGFYFIHIYNKDGMIREKIKLEK